MGEPRDKNGVERELGIGQTLSFCMLPAPIFSHIFMPNLSSIPNLMPSSEKSYDLEAVLLLNIYLQYY